MSPPQEPGDRLREIRERLEAATPGPWESDGDSEESYSEGDVSVWSKHCDDPCPDSEHGGILFNVGPPITQVGVACNREREDGRFIAHCREDIPYLLGEVSRLQREKADVMRGQQSLADQTVRIRKALGVPEGASGDTEDYARNLAAAVQQAIQEIETTVLFTDDIGLQSTAKRLRRALSPSEATQEKPHE